MGSAAEPAYLYKNVTHDPTVPSVKSAEGIYIFLENGQKILDATSGAAVSAIGHGVGRVKKAIMSQLDQVEYCHPGFFPNTPAMDLADLLVESTGGKLSRACILGSGSEAVEAAMKLAYQYFEEQSPNTRRTRFISRHGSWHGCTLGALALGDFKPRKTRFNSILTSNISHVSACDPYHGLMENEDPETYVARLKDELDNEFQRLGPETVCAVFLEPMVGTALGCVTALPGYLQAVRDVCDRYGALLVFDEIMCGMGRTGITHVWQEDGVAPDIELVGKGLAAGYGTISGLLVNDRVLDGLRHGGGYFVHGQTYQSHPLGCAAAVEVQRIIKEENLVENCRKMGQYLGQQLKLHLGDHPYVGDIRGRGLFWAVEFMADPPTKTPFSPAFTISKRMQSRGMERGYDICLFAATGAVDGCNGDHVLLAPPYIVHKEDVDEIVSRLVRTIDSVFEDVAALVM
ncbi:class III aminotransferase [Aspergillus flavus]|uniref:Class III aminotransferase n=1 Tax=Aspergillus flavus TaxID=5059 RepID=A0AB74BSW6_ASPFL|nr:class III aminotransferase [Aspergillus flavus]RAQ76811.1 class III aminotransferase [Aspergillus flavus]RMZ37578.1 class III aminotransferase [Aspergillus flavus]